MSIEKNWGSGPRRPETELQRIKTEIIQARTALEQTNLIVVPKYWDETSVVIFFEEDETEAVKQWSKNLRIIGNEIYEVEENDYKKNDFTQGRRTDFIGSHTKEYFKKWFTKERLMDFSEEQIFSVMFMQIPEMPFEEFIAHETAHNIFDRAYIERYGSYEETDNGRTEMDDEYINIVKKRMIPYLQELQKRFPLLNLEKFQFRRQSIAEMYTYLLQREFARRIGRNIEMHDQVDKNLGEFLMAPEEQLRKFNEKYGKKCTMETFYQDSHTLSLLLAPLLEQAYPDWEERKKIFKLEGL